MIATMVANPPKPDAQCKTTLLVATPSLIDQWMDELRKHVEPGIIGSIIKYHAKSKVQGDGAVEVLKHAAVYVEVSTLSRR